jgi:ATP-dependent helicase YprA (DUF1998 family)
MPINPIKASEAIKSNYISYLSTVFHVNDMELQEQFINLLEQDNKFVKGPILEATPSFQLGNSLQELIDENVLSNLFSKLDKDSFDINRRLYRHQEKAIRKVISENRNIVVATGTGSGKTETFLIPILNHLLMEKENGLLGPGVRALLLYPMNALANDQMSRIRALLKKLPSITFGRYTGETEKEYKKALDNYMKQYHAEPIENELISREQMWVNPPNILLTNYAMLEYLLLRPDDSVFFDGSYAGHWRYLVLDEAHTYKGAKGIEMAMLLRRLKDRISFSGSEELRCIATSATLGKGKEEFGKITEFASQLFGEKFEWDDNDVQSQDIIESEKIPLCMSSECWGKPDKELYLTWNTLCSNPSENIIESLFRSGIKNGVLQDILLTARKTCDNDWRKFLYYVLKGDEYVQEVQKALQERPQSLSDLAENIFGEEKQSHEILASLVDISNKAKLKNDTPPLLPARYHLFTRAVEGMYLRLKPDKQLYLERYKKVKCEDKEYPVYEVAACSQCGAIYLVGQVIKEGYESFLHQCAESYSNNIDYFLLDVKNKQLTEFDEDEEVGLNESTLQIGTSEEFKLCAVCGAIDRVKSTRKLCNCSEENYYTVFKVAKGKDGRVYKCPACGKCSPKGIIWRFLTGTEASASVLCNALYQQIEPKLVESKNLKEVEGDGWEASIEEDSVPVYESRKLLAFSDSRQDAAFFAPYFNRTYNQILRRSLIIHTLIDHRADIRENKWRLQDLAEPVRNNAEKADYLKGMSMQEKKSEVWKWLMYELIAMDRKHSLEGLGLLGFELSKPEGWGPPKILMEGKWSLTGEEVWTLYRILIDSLRIKGAVVFPDYVSPEDEFFQPRNREFYFRSKGSENKKGILSWNTNSRNSRLDYLIKLAERLDTGITPEECADVLLNIWDKSIKISDPQSRWKNHIKDLVVPREGLLYRLNYTVWELKPTLVDDGTKWYRCNKCNMITMNNIRDVCPNYRCNGQLTSYNPLVGNEKNHYFNLYTNSRPYSMKCEEHTAQLRSETASELQNRFIDGEINVLSCSTTFEMGVDVGELETVFMRNVPPSSANYIQRAGRAGRRADSTAFVLTFAQRRSHDISYYNQPEMMVTGKITAPYFKVENVKILRRHVFSTAFSQFWRENRSYFGKTQDFFLNEKESGIVALKAFLDSKPIALGNSIKRIVPENMWQDIGIYNWEWTNKLFNETDGVLYKAHQEITEDLNCLEEIRVKLFNERKYIGHLDRLIKTIKEKNLIGYLSSRNVLPKYGFPVDVVELELIHHGEDAKRLQLERDLRVAISEYAPGGQIIAGGKLWTSRYVKRLTRMEWDSYRYAICDYCKNYSRIRAELSENFNSLCPVCGQTFGRNSGVFIIPSFGFMTGLDTPGNPKENKPERTYSTRVYYSGEAVEEESRRINFLNDSILITPASNGRMAVINNGNGGGFSICNVCGYTVLSGQKPPKPHPGPRGQSCFGTFRSHISLGHEFETDILKIEFISKQENNYGFWLSLLYAIIEGACLGLGIERNDLDGCLSPIDGNISKFALIIYDDVPGGAGHVRRIAQSENMIVVMEAALNKLKSCECGGEQGGTSCYGCLRNYGNQFCHELLDRGIVLGFLKEILG